MEDGFENYYAMPILDSSNNAATKLGPDDDKDGDGRPNRIEAIEGTLPRSSSESLSLNGSYPNLSVKWFGKSNAHYRILWYSSSTGVWQFLPGSIVGTNKEIARTVLEITGGTALPTSFFATLRTFGDPVLDTDGDGLSDLVESFLGTSFNQVDSDGDSILDGQEDKDLDGIDNKTEVTQGTDANNDKDFPAHCLVITKSIYQQWNNGTAEEPGFPQGDYEIFRSWDQVEDWDFLYDVPLSAQELNNELAGVTFPVNPPANATRILLDTLIPATGSHEVVESLFSDSNLIHKRIWIKKPIKQPWTSHNTSYFLGDVATSSQPDRLYQPRQTEFPENSELSNPIDILPTLSESNSSNQTTTWITSALHPIDMKLLASGKIPVVPEVVETVRVAWVQATGPDLEGNPIDDLGPLPMGTGRANAPGLAYTAPIVVSAHVPLVQNSPWRWQRFIYRKSWRIRNVQNKWIVELRTTRGSVANPEPDLVQSVTDDTPSATSRVYAHDASALLPNDGEPALASGRTAPGDYVFEKKQFFYEVQFANSGSWQTIAKLDVGQKIIAKRITDGGTAVAFSGVENSNEIRNLSNTISEEEVREIVKGNLPIEIDPTAN